MILPIEIPYSSVEEFAVNVAEYKCRHSTTCLNCPIYRIVPNGNADRCYEWAQDHPYEALRLFGINIKSPWVSFDERMPEGHALAYSPKRDRYYGINETMYELHLTNEDIEYCGATHWMPLDIPFKEEG